MRVRRPWALGLTLAAIALWAALPPRAASGASMPRGKPNVVIILIDTLRPDHLSFYGYPTDTSPFLTGIAGESFVFENVFSVSSHTAPASASLFTSLSPEDHGVIRSQIATERMRSEINPKLALNRIPEEATTLPELMKEAGYRTYGISDNYNVSDEMGFDQGFDEFIDNPRFYWGAPEVARRVMELRETINSGGPYFLYIHFIDPHKPYHRRKPWFSEPGPPSRGSRKGASPVPAWRVGAPKTGTLDTPGRDVNIAKYDSEIGYVDARIEDLYRTFGWDKNTLLVVTSDHGEQFYEHGHLGHGWTLYDEVLRIPLMIHDATGRIGPGRSASPASILDILPGVMDFLGAGIPSGIHGRSFMPLTEGEAGDDGEPRILFGHLERFLLAGKDPDLIPHGKSHDRQVFRTAHRGPWKLIVDTSCESELYDRSSDPAEQEDVLAIHPDVTADLAARLLEHMSRAKAFEPSPFEKELTPEELERLRTLGYVE